MLRKGLCAALMLGSLAACGRDPLKDSSDLLKKGDMAGAISALQALELKKPELKAPHYELFLIERLQASQAGGKSDQITEAAIAEYTWICRAEGIDSDYQRMEETLKASDKTKAAFEAAYALVYPR